MEYFLQVAYSFFTTITCFDSPLSIHLNGVKSMEILVSNCNILLQYHRVVDVMFAIN